MAYTTIDDPSAFFQTKTYAGTGSQLAVTLDGNSDMQPDWIWYKNRGTTNSHGLQDVVRGFNTTGIQSTNGTDADPAFNGSSLGYVSAVASDGFTVEAGNCANASSNNYVAWCWKAGTSFTNDASSTSVGSIDSSGSTSTTAGFSIVTIDSMPANTTSTFAHNLGVKPDFIIFKSRNLTTNWDVYHSSALPDGERKLYLNDTDAVIDSGFMNDTAPTSSVVSFNPGSSVSNHIAYCFAEKKGYSKFGSYKGNASTNGTYVHTGFKPAIVIVKKTAGTGSWFIKDTKRDPGNPTEITLASDSASSEAGWGTGDDIDILSNGFKFKDDTANINTNDDAYVYMTWAEAPFVNSNGVPTNAR